VGSGIYVNAPPASEQEAHAGPIEGPFEVLRARAFVESAVAEEAARQAKPEDIARLDAVLAEVDAQGTLNVERWVALDRSFHRAVAAVLGNVVLLRTVGELFDQRINPYFTQLAKHLENDATWRAAHVEHVAIRDAIASHQPEGARAAMREHLELSHRRFARDFGEALFAETDRELGRPPAKTALAGGERGNPLKTRKPAHAAAAY
jgi:DNA-binding FadR family transcriptional regulator